MDRLHMEPGEWRVVEKMPVDDAVRAATCGHRGFRGAAQTVDSGAHVCLAGQV